MKRILVLCTVFVALAGCATWMRVDQRTTVQPDNRYRVELPKGWVWVKPGEADIVVSRDGLDIQRIVIRHDPLANAYVKLDKKAHPGMLPSELAELEIADIKSHDGMETVEVVENAPASVGGHEGYRLHLAYRNAGGLRYERVVYGCVTRDGLFTLFYDAPSLHYFQRDLAQFERVVKSFRPAGARHAAARGDGRLVWLELN
ncbi:MAG: DUF1795 domain-containing protein [Gammaproteobacteria bacterium]|nr:DUF1795 domain-containing protein [Gammaproteobacteria bacterium]